MQNRFNMGVIINMGNKLVQKSGENSQQIQVEKLIVHSGIDEKRAREIYEEIYEKEKRQELTEEAVKIAEKRIRELENILIPRMKKIEGAINAFGNPEFQYLLSSAHRTAAMTDKKEDYELLSELLIHRLEKGNDKKAVVGINKVISLINEISDDALLGITVCYVIQKIIPEQGYIEQGIDKMNDLYGNLMYSKLPLGSEWIEELEILGAIRINPYSHFKKFNELYKEIFKGYYCTGIKKDSEKYHIAMEKIKKESLDGILFEHEINKEYVRLPVVNRYQIDNITERRSTLFQGRTIENKIELSNKQKQALYEIYDSYEENFETERNNYNRFIEMIKEKENIKNVGIWYDNIALDFDFTLIGKIIANVNAKRIYKDIPPLH